METLVHCSDWDIVIIIVLPTFLLKETEAAWAEFCNTYYFPTDDQKVKCRECKQ